MKNNIFWHDHVIDRPIRARMKKQQPCIIWLTGLSGSGKSTIAGSIENKLAIRLQHTYLMDGDNVRHGLCRDLSFSTHDRNENIRRVGEVASLMLDAGLIVLTAFISPFKYNRELVRNMVDKNKFIEVFIDTPIEVCEKRDQKSLYIKARSGEIKNFTGVSSPYERPADPEIHINNHNISANAAANQVIHYLDKHGYLECN